MYMYVYTDTSPVCHRCGSCLHLDQLHERFIGKTDGTDRKEEVSSEFSYENENQNFSFELTSREHCNDCLL